MRQFRGQLANERGGKPTGAGVVYTNLMVGSALGCSWDHAVSTMGNSDSEIKGTGGGLGGDNLTGVCGGRFLKTSSRFNLPARALGASGGARALA